MIRRPPRSPLFPYPTLFRANGAVGNMVLGPPQQDAILPWARSVIGMRFPSMRWLGPDSRPSDTFAEMRGGAALSTAASERVFQHASKSWEQVLSDAAGSKPQSFDLPIKAKIQVVSRHRETDSPNVVAVLPGSDPSLDRKSTRLNSSHGYISYAVFCLKKKKTH